MRWRTRRRSTNVIDRRGRRVGGPIGLGIGGLVVVVLAVLFGADPRQVLGLVQASGGSETAYEAPAEEQELTEFVRVVLADTEEVWSELFARDGQTYREPRLVLFRDAVRSACGTQSAAVGPFYCPGDQQVYLDLSFFDQLDRRLGAPGDFAQAYVIAHEVGHHVQNLLGISDRVHELRRRQSEAEANRMSVRLELQADYLAGVWAHHAERRWDVLEPGDVEEALRAASRIGDDHLQERSGGVVMPDSFTHGTSEQRVRWFRRGLESGDPDGGDTFAAERL